MNGKTKAQAASDYFNSLPFEERGKLAPLLEDYRRMGVRAALTALESKHRAVERDLSDRLARLDRFLDSPEAVSD